MEKQDIIQLIAGDSKMMEILNQVRSLNLPDWWIGAGFVRNKVWDYLHDFSNRTEKDVDIIYFDRSDITEETEKEIEQDLKNKNSDIDWSIKNQARMHIRNNHFPYTSSIDALSRWPETATCVAVKIDTNNQLFLEAPFGIEDIVNMKVRLNPYYPRLQIFEERIKNKNWIKIWPQLKYII